MGKTKVTISRIADLMNVSPITVSRALSSQPGVGDALREEIKRKAKELGYKKTKCSDTFSVLLLIRKRFVADNSNFSLMVQGLEHHTRESGIGFAMEFVERDKQDKLVLPHSLTKNHNFDGVILLGQFEDQYAVFIRELIPNMVMFNGSSDEVDCGFVYFDFNRTGYQAARYLVGKGHRKIGFIGVEGKFNTCQRFLGFARALDLEGIEVNPTYIVNAQDGLEESITVMIDNDDLPTAFVCNTDRTSLHLIKYLHERGISVPNQVSVIGSGNTEMAALAIPSLTTFELNLDYACAVTVRTLLERISQPELPSVSVFVKAKFVERKSAGHVPL